MLLESKTQEEIAKELNVNVRTVQRYTLEIDKRYGEAQAQKTDNTLFMECALFKNRMLALYKGLEDTVLSKTSSGGEKAKCAEVAANIAIDVLKMESEGIKAVKELVTKKDNALNNLRNDNDIINNNHQEQESTRDSNRKF
jgi:hypothetical protein